MTREPSAHDAYRLLMRDHIAPALRGRGYKGAATKAIFWSLTGDYATEIAFLKSRHSNRANVYFEAELTVYYVPDEEEIWAEGTSGLAPVWEFPGEWTVEAGQPIEPVAADLLAGFGRYVWPALQTTYEHHRYPGDEERRWARTFPEMPEDQHDSDESPGGVLALLGSMLADGLPPRAVSLARMRAMDERVMHEPALVQEYLRRLEHDRSFGVRSKAAEQLRLVADRPGVRAALRQAAEDGEHWSVRWNASYALKLAGV